MLLRFTCPASHIKTEAEIREPALLAGLSALAARMNSHLLQALLWFCEVSGLEKADVANKKSHRKVIEKVVRTVMVCKKVLCLVLPYGQEHLRAGTG